MNKFSKVISLCLILVMTALFLTGCANNNLASVYRNQTDINENAGTGAQETNEPTDEEDEAQRIAEIKEDLSKILIESDIARLDEFSVEDLEAFQKLKNSLIRNLRVELKNNRVNVTAEADTGAVSFKPSAIYHSEDNRMASEGEKLLNQLLPVYTFVIYNNRYEGLVSEILVEYHAGADESQALAQSRLNKVIEYSTSGQPAISSSYDGRFKSILKPMVFPYDGTGDEAGEIIFKFLLHLNNEN